MAQLEEHLNSVEAREQDWYVFNENRDRRVLRHCRKGVATGFFARSFLDGFLLNLPAGRGC